MNTPPASIQTYGLVGLCGTSCVVQSSLNPEQFASVSPGYGQMADDLGMLVLEAGSAVAPNATLGAELDEALPFLWNLMLMAQEELEGT